jgi:tetratricopeptide (TPR) repeat protein
VLDVWQADFPRDPLPHLLRGRVYEHLGNWGLAEKEYLAALAQEPKHAATAYNLARLYLSQNKPEKALEYYRLCDAATHGGAPARIGIAHCLRLLEQPEEARALLEAVLSEDSAQRELQFRAVGEPAEAAHTAAEAQLGQLELVARNYAEAVRWLEPAVTANPRDWKVRYALATALRSLGRTAEADAHLARVQEIKAALKTLDTGLDALQGDPANVEVRYQIGMVFLKHLSENQGLVWLHSVLTYDPRHAATHRALAEYYGAKAAENPQFAALAQEHRHLAEEPSNEN